MSHVASITKASRKNVTRLALAVTALAAIAGCTNSEEDSSISGPGATPRAGQGQIPSEGGAEKKSAEPTSGAEKTAGHKVVALRGANAADYGSAEFTQKGGSVEITLTVKGLTPGFHGVHIHNVGKCEPVSLAPGTSSPTGAFLSSGAHYQVPGSMTEPMSGDLTNLLVLRDGTGSLSFSTDGFQLSQLAGGAGTSLIIHEKASNFANIPADKYKSVEEGGKVPDDVTIHTQDAGGRTACGVIAPPA